MKKLILWLVSFLTLSTSANAQLGSLSSDLVFTPVTPCRILDTRNAGVKSGVLQANTARGFWGWNSTFGPQGGSATSCGTLESTATAAILVNFTVVTPDTSGYITAYPANVADANKPLAATVNFTAGSVIGNNATVKLNQTGTGDDFKIYTTSNVHVVADIVGFYSKPVATALTCMTTTAVSSAVASPSGIGGLYYGFAIPAACPAGTTQISMRCTTNSALVTASIYDSNGNLDSEQCVGQSPVNGYLLRANRVCCNLPGR